MSLQDRIEKQPESTRILLTGGSGKLGSRLIRALLNLNYHVIALDRQPLNILGTNFEFYEVDLKNIEEIAPLFAGVDAVVHSAALHGLHLPQYDQDSFFSNNVRGLFNVLQACERYKIPRIVFTSTTGVYGTAADPRYGEAAWVDEGLPRLWRTDNIYSATKVLGEDMCAHYAQRYAASVVSLRCTRYVAPNEDGLSENRRLLSQGVDVRDAVQAHYLALSRPIGHGFEAFNIGPDLPYTRADLNELFTDAPAVIRRYFSEVEQLLSHVNIELPRRIGRVYDITKARQTLGYSPEHSFVDFLGEIQNAPQ